MNEPDQTSQAELVAELLELRRANTLLREKLARQDVLLEEAARDRYVSGRNSTLFLQCAKFTSECPVGPTPNPQRPPCLDHGLTTWNTSYLDPEGSWHEPYPKPSRLSGQAEYGDSRPDTYRSRV